MGQPIVMPKLGQTAEDSTIVRWLKKEGETIAKGETIFEIETDKAVLQVESFYEGTLLKIYVGEGRTVPVQSVVAYVGQPGETAPAAPPPAPLAPVAKPETVPAPTSAAAPRPVPTPRPAPMAPVPALAPATPTPALFRISPRARKLARECAMSPSGIIGTGGNGRVVERDVKAYLEKKGYDQILITPTAKNLAAKEGLDVFTLEGTGTSGRITVADVERAVAERPKPMSKMRQIIAQRLTQSFTTTPHFFVTVSVDVSDLLDLRLELRKKDVRVSVTDFLLKAVALCLLEYPEVNSTADGVTAQWHSHVNLGLAVSLDGGLVVPVIAAAEELTLLELHDYSADLVKRAREGKLTPAEMTGSTFTISNMGMLNVENFTAIINPGESAILAVSSVVKTPVVRNDEIAVRSMMKITLSSDHRMIDGALAARFINAIKKKIEDMDLWKRMT